MTPFDRESSAICDPVQERREPRPPEAAGVQRRVIEGEGLGGFARR